MNIRANKPQIKQAVKDLYDIDADRVNTLIRPDGQKKAYVRLSADADALELANKVGYIVFSLAMLLAMRFAGISRAPCLSRGSLPIAAICLVSPHRSLISTVRVAFLYMQGSSLSKCTHSASIFFAVRLHMLTTWYPRSPYLTNRSVSYN